MNQAVDAVQVDECSEVDDVRNLALTNLPWLELLDDLLALTLASLLKDGSARENDIVPLTIDLDHLARDLCVEELIEIGHAANVDKRCGQKAADPEVDDQATLNYLNDGAFDGFAGLGSCLNAAPGLLEAGTLLGDDQPTFLILLCENENIDLLP